MKIVISKTSGFGILAPLVVVFLATVPTSMIAQKPNVPSGQSLQHITADAMSAADRATVEMQQRELGEAARIYGYSFEGEKWVYEQTLCSSMPETILLHYRQMFPDGTESLFTALVPRAAGRVHIVPLLYHNTTPFVPAPRNPSNYTLFNELVPADIARKEVTPNGDWLQLSACYAEMTGGDVNISSDGKVNIGVATAPLPTNHIEIEDKTIRVTFADRESERKYRVWSISFNRNGRVKSATTEDRPAYAGKNTLSSQIPQMSMSPQSSETTDHPATESRPIAATANPFAENQAQSCGNLRSSVPTGVSMPARDAPSRASEATGEVPSQADETSSEPGWRLVTHPAEPPSKIVPRGSPPPEKITPEPPDPTVESASPQ